MKSSRQIDMTTGSILGKILIFSVPIIISNILQQLYTTVDTLVVSNFCGEEALAAIGTSAQPIEILICLFLGIGSGVSILISQFTGAKDAAGIDRITRAAVDFVYLSGIPMSIIGYLMTPWLLQLMGCPDNAMDQAIIYTSVTFLGSLASIGYNMNAGILRGLGDSKAALWFLFLSCITNVGLDLLFVPVFHMGILGAAVATIIAQYVSWLASIIYTRVRYKEVAFTVLPCKCQGRDLWKVVTFGIPLGLNQALFSFGHAVMQVMVNAQGTVFMAGTSAGGRVNGISSISISAISQAASAYSGQNFGAGNIDRIRWGYLRIPLISGALTLGICMIFLLFRTPLLQMFSQDPEVLYYADRYVVVQMWSLWLFAVYNCAASIINGTGKLAYTTWVNIMLLWVVRIPSAFLIMTFYDGTWIMLGNALSFAFGSIAILGYYAFSKSWKKLLARPNFGQAAGEVQKMNEGAER